MRTLIRRSLPLIVVLLLLTPVAYSRRAVLLLD